MYITMPTAFRIAQAMDKERPRWSVVKRNLRFVLTTIPFADRRARRYLQHACDEARRPAIMLLSTIQLITLHRAKGRETEAAKCLDEAGNSQVNRRGVDAGRYRCRS